MNSDAASCNHTLQRHWLVFEQFVKLRRKELISTYVFVPFGVLLIMCLLYGVDRLIVDYIKVTFPASVAVMLINFAFMCCLAALKKPYVDWYVNIIDVPLSWSLRWMNVFFTPAFVTLPLSPWISFKEALLIVAVFIIGYLTAFVVLAYITILGQKVAGSRRLKSMFIRQEELQNGMEEGSSFAPVAKISSKPGAASTSNNNSDDDKIGDNGSNDTNLQPYYMEPYELDLHDPLVNLASNSGISLSRYNSRATSILPTASNSSEDHVPDGNQNPDDELEIGPSCLLNNPSGPAEEANTRISLRSRQKGNEKSNVLQKLQPALYKNPEVISAMTVDSSQSPNICRRAITHQFSKKFDIYFSINTWDAHLHHLIYGLGFFATIFTYYFQWCTTPFHFFTAVAMFMIITDSPFITNRPKLKKVAHPVICSVAMTWIIMLISVMIKHRKIVYFLRELREYKTGRTYLHLFDNEKYGYHEWPGAGDIFSSCMDVAIVGLSMPMYTYRKDLKKHFFSMVPPILIFTAASLLLYPLICYHIGISSLRSIGFAGRSVTLALGTPMISNLGGDQTVMAVTTVMSGVVGALTGGPMLDFIRVPEEDYVTRGLTLGCNCGAIATAYLLGVDRRAAAISSLSFVFYGAIMVILSAIGPVKTFIHAIVGLQ